MRRMWILVLMLSLLATLGVMYIYSEQPEQAKEVSVVKDVQETKDNNNSLLEPKVKDKKPESKPLKVVAVGDILLGRAVGHNVEKKPERYLYPFLKVAEITRKSDIVFGNLEESITSSTKCLTGIKQNGKYVLKNEVEAINGIKYVGFNLLSIANNHILDYYEKGLFDTIDILDKNSIAHAGAGKNLDEARKMTVIEKDGMKIGLLAYTDMADVLYKGNPPLRFLATKDKPGVAPTVEDYIKEDVAREKGTVDILIVSFHWGVENSFNETQKQIEFSHYLMDNGVDIIFGHHPHRVQGVEIYKGKPIFYSLGNFMFDQNDLNNQQGFIMSMEFTNKKLTSLEGTPFKIIKKEQIVPQTGKDALDILNREIELCKKMNTNCIIKNDKLVFQI